jgi:hypothetical protein
VCIAIVHVLQAFTGQNYEIDSLSQEVSRFFSVFLWKIWKNGFDIYWSYGIMPSSVMGTCHCFHYKEKKNT